MMPIAMLERYDAHLSKLSDIINGLNVGYGYVSVVLAWLDELEQISKVQGDRVSADIALTRGKISSYIPSQEELQTVTRGQRQKLQIRYIVMCLEELKSCLDNYMAPSRKLIDETEVLCYKLAAVAAQKGYVPEDDKISEVISLITHDSDLMPAWVNVIGTVGKNNALIIMERALKEVR
jgi:hypothetical protein